MNLIKLHNKVKKLSTIKLILLALIAMFILQIFIEPLFRIIPISDSNEAKLNDYFGLNKPDNLFYVIFCGGIYSPIIETLVYQMLIIRLILLCTKRIFKKENFAKYFIPILISSIAFGFAHYYGYYSLIKVLSTFLIGLVLAYTYIVAYRTNRKASLIVMCIHAIWNTCLFTLGYLC